MEFFGGGWGMSVTQSIGVGHIARLGTNWWCVLNIPPFIRAGKLSLRSALGVFRRVVSPQIGHKPRLKLKNIPSWLAKGQFTPVRGKD